MSPTNLPEGWVLVELGELRAPGDYTFVGGPFGSDLTRDDYLSEPGVPVIRGINLGGDEGRFVDDGFVYVSEHKAQVLRRNMAFPGDLIFTQRGTLGQVASIPLESRFKKYVISQSQMKLTPDTSRVIGQFLYHYFRAPHTLDRILSRTQATGVPHINLGILRSFPVTLPSLAEQQRITDVLDRAEELRAKRLAAIAQLDTLTHAIFLALFGDPATNPRGWEISKVDDAADVQGGLQVSSARKDCPLEVPYLRVANVFRGFLDLTEIKTLRATGVEVARTRLMKDDLLIVEGHGNPDELGRGALWDGSIAECVHQNHIIRVRFSDQKLLPRYACEYLNSVGGRRHLLRAGKTTSGLNTISVSEVRAAPVAVPPLTLQRNFARQAGAVEKLKAAYRASLAELDELFAALQHRAFRGEL